MFTSQLNEVQQRLFDQWFALTSALPARERIELIAALQTAAEERLVQEERERQAAEVAVFLQQPQVIEDLQRMGLQVNAQLHLTALPKTVGGKIVETLDFTARQGRQQVTELQIKSNQIYITSTTKVSTFSEIPESSDYQTNPEQSRYLLLRECNGLLRLLLPGQYVVTDGPYMSLLGSLPCEKRASTE